MPPQRRLWDANVVLDYLSGNEKVQPDCGLIIQRAERGEVEIVVSTIAEAEVAFLPGFSAHDAESKILEFFSRNYVITAAFDSPIARIARRLIRQYRLQDPSDAVHWATAIRWQVPVLETNDSHLLDVSGKEGNPPVVTQRPTYQGTLSLFPPGTG